MGAAIAGVEGPACVAATWIVRMADRRKFEALSGCGGSLKGVFCRAAVVEDGVETAVVA